MINTPKDVEALLVSKNPKKRKLTEGPSPTPYSRFKSDEVLKDLRILAESASHPRLVHNAVMAQAEYILKKYGWENPYAKKGDDV